jgi:hypothetical protein
MPHSSDSTDPRPIDPRRHALDNERSERRAVRDHQDARLAGLGRLRGAQAEVPTDVEADLEQWRDEIDPERRRAT